MFNQMKSGGIDGYSYYISSDSDDEACRGSDRYIPHTSL